MKRKFVIEAEMEEHWIPYFLSMLKHMEKLGVEGKEDVIGIYSDGKVDFKPKFHIDFEFETKKPQKYHHSYVYDGTVKK